MAAKVRRLLSKPDRLREEQAALLRDALLPFQHDMPDQVRELVAYVDRQTAAKAGWTFIMISAEQNRAVVRWLKANSRRPMQAMDLWSLLFTRVDRDTGEVLLTRDQLAELVGDTADNISAIMGELEKIDAIIRRRERVAGMRGPGRVRYFMNPVVGTHLAGGERDKAQAEAPPGPLLRVMQGGKADEGSTL
jgi:hypothetical protein